LAALLALDQDGVIGGHELAKSKVLTHLHSLFFHYTIHFTKCKLPTAPSFAESAILVFELGAKGGSRCRLPGAPSFYTQNRIVSEIGAIMGSRPLLALPCRQ
jgi:hypothetical protein